MMSLKLQVEGVMVEVVSGYTPQVKCELEEGKIDDIIQDISRVRLNDPRP